MPKISGLTAIEAVDLDNDLVVMVDASDTTHAGTGTTKKATPRLVFGAVSPPIATAVVAASGTTNPGTATLCDGTADNVQIQAAIDAVSAAGGGTVFLRAGAYTLAASLNMAANVELVGESKKATLTYAGVAINLADDCALKNLTVEGQVNGSDAERVTLDDCVFDANGQTYGVFLDAGCDSLSMTRCRVTGATSHGMFVDDSSRGYYAGNVFDTNGGMGLRMYDCGAAASSPNAVWNPPLIIGNLFVGNTTFGAGFEGVHDLRVTGCNFERNGDGGIYIDAPIEAAIVGNHIEYNNQNSNDVADVANNIGGICVDLGSFAAYNAAGPIGSLIISSNNFNGEYIGIHLQWANNVAYRVAIQGNEMYLPTAGGSTTVTAGWGIRAVGLQVNNVFDVSGNVVYGASNLVGNNQRGIELVGNAAATDAKRMTVRNNTAINLHRGIQLQSFATPTAEGNRVTDCDLGFRLFDVSDTYLISNVVEDNNTDVSTGGTVTGTTDTNVAL